MMELTGWRNGITCRESMACYVKDTDICLEFRRVCASEDGRVSELCSAGFDIHFANDAELIVSNVFLITWNTCRPARYVES